MSQIQLSPATSQALDVIRLPAPLTSHQRNLFMAKQRGGNCCSAPFTKQALRIAPIGASLALLALGLRTPPARAQNAGTEGPSTRSTGAASRGTRAIPANTNAGAPPAIEAPESLSQSIQRRKDFPFPARCDGNTQEMAACLWQQRDRADLRLRRLVGNKQTLERWRAARLTVCQRSAERGAGGSIQPLLWLGCENALNTTLIEQLTSPLLR